MSGSGGSTGGSTFAIELEDKTSAPSRSAAQALEQLRTKIDADTKSLRSMQAAMARLKGGTSTNVTAFRQLRAQVAAQRESIAQAQAAYVSLGGTWQETTEKGAGFEDIFKQIRGAGGPVGSLAGRFAALANPISAVVAIATVGIGIFVAFAAAVVGAALALGRMALASADARRSEALHLEGLVTLRNHYGVAAGSATDLMRAIDRVSDSSAQSRTEVSAMAQSLYRAGLRGANLEDALSGLDIAQSVQGDRGAARFRAMAVSIARTGGSVRRLADDYRARLGGIATRQALGLDRQMERLRESVGRIFGDVRIEGFLSGMHEVLNLFSQSTITGRALHQIATTIFSPMFDQVGESAPTVVHFFRGMVIETQRVVIAALRLRNQFRRTFGTETTGAIDRGTQATTAGRFAIMGLGVALAAVVIPLALVGLAAYGAWQRFQQMATTAALIRDALGRATDALIGYAADWRSAGASLVDGFIGGITAGLGRVTDTVSHMATAATTSLTEALGIHSPSRVFAELGEQIPRGLAVGVDSATSEATGAVASMSEATAGGGSASAPSARGGVTFGDVHVHPQSGTEAEARQYARAFMEELASLLEGSSREMGAA